MSKYIDKDELWERLRKHMVHHIVTNTLFNTIKAVINGMPTIEVSEDCIDRKKLLEQIDKDSEGSPGYYGDTWQFINTIENAPSVVPSRAEGEWIYIDEPIIGNPYGRYRCLECELEQPHKTDYCPNCGCDMRGVE